MPGQVSASRFVRRSAAPFLMLFLCLCGMATGLAIDCGSIPPDVLASLCTGGSDSFLHMVEVHWSLLPATHVMMLVGAATAIGMTEFGEGHAGGHPATALGRGTACAGLMLAGMMAGGWLS